MVRRLLVVGMVLCAVAGVAACNDQEATPSTTSAEPETTETTTPETIPDEEYTGEAESFVSGVEEAGTDFCSVMELGLSFPDVRPSTSAQVKGAVDAVVEYLGALSAVESVDPEIAAILAEVAQELAAAAETADYPLDFFENPENAEPLRSQEYADALGALLQRAEDECGTTIGVPGEVDE